MVRAKGTRMTFLGAQSQMQNSLFSAGPESSREHTRKPREPKFPKQAGLGEKPTVPHHTEALTGVGCPGEEKAYLLDSKGPSPPPHSQIQYQKFLLDC